MKKYLLICLPLFLTSCSTIIVTHAYEGFFENHSIWQLIAWMVFPRLMFWFFSVITGGFFFWLGVFFVPRIMVAFWATSYYWHTNPILCIVAWIIALTGESAEKKSATKVF